MRAKAFGGTLTFAQCVEGGVEALPSLSGRHLAGRPRVLPRGRDGVDDRGTVARRVVAGSHTVGQRPHVQLTVGSVNSQDLQQHSRNVIGVDAGILQQLVHGDVEDACGVIGALDVATDPVQRFGIAGEHQRITACCCCCCCCSGCCSRSGCDFGRLCCWNCFCDCFGFSPSESPLVAALGSFFTTSAAPSSRSAPDVRDARTQVSLDPPPWLELTTRDPSTSATRVRPPGSTHTSSPSLTANGRRST